LTALAVEFSNARIRKARTQERTRKPESEKEDLSQMFLSSSFPDLFWFLAFKFLCLPAPVVRGRRSSQIGKSGTLIAS